MVTSKVFRRRRLAALTAIAVALSSTTAWAVASGDPATTTTTTTTTLPTEQPQAGWTIMDTGARGVQVDRELVAIAGVPFTVVRFRTSTTVLHWHPGTEDPPKQTALVALLGTHPVWITEGKDGVLAVFNGAFKLSANAGVWKYGKTVINPVEHKGYGTLMLDANGIPKIIAWGVDPMPSNYTPVLIRQNEPMLVDGGAPTTTAANPSQAIWGATYKGFVRVARTGLGIDANGNLLYVATMSPCAPLDLAKALVAAGAVKGMENDINPYWPVMGIATTPIHDPSGNFAFTLPGAEHNPRVMLVPWLRDFFSVSIRP